MTQFLASMKHPRFHGANPRASYCSNLLDGVAKAISKYQDQSLLQRQSIQSFLDPILLLEFISVNRAIPGQVPGQVLDLSRYDLILVISYRFQGGTISDAYNPRRKTGRVTKVPRVPPDSDERVFDNFLAIFPSPNKSRHKAGNPTMIGRIETLKSAPISRSNKCYQRSILKIARGWGSIGACMLVHSNVSWFAGSADDVEALHVSDVAAVVRCSTEAETLALGDGIGA